MTKYRYVGHDYRLLGHTALGQVIDGVFKVQVHSHQHPWAFGWHETPREDWQEFFTCNHCDLHRDCAYQLDATFARTSDVLRLARQGHLHRDCCGDVLRDANERDVA